MTPPQLTYTGVVLAVLANQLCLPVPAVVFLMAAGALSAQGHMRFGLVVLLSALPAWPLTACGSGWAAGGACGSSMLFAD